ncbi:hypothetical protein [Enterobacter cloacae]|uniref:hypothetical protein n=1 Tax=Enterobacter cloacae TaxID=550 RepID=UPI00300E7DB3
MDEELRFKNVRAANVGTFFDGPKTVMSFDDIDLNGVEKFIHFRDSDSSILERLGLPKDTPPEFLIELITSLAEKKDMNFESKVGIVGKSKLFEWLGAGANLMTIAEPIIRSVQENWFK